MTTYTKRYCGHCILKRVLLFFALNSLILSTPSVYAHIDAKQAITAIIGEAEGEPFIGKVAVAEAIRNRKTLKGVYGLRSPRVKKASKKVWLEAERAWLESEKSNLVKGADHWESIDFKVPGWAKGMIVTAQIGKHTFYKAK